MNDTYFGIARNALALQRFSSKVLTRPQERTIRLIRDRLLALRAEHANRVSDESGRLHAMSSGFTFQG